jgi:hypothetical protein
MLNASIYAVLKSELDGLEWPADSPAILLPEKKYPVAMYMLLCGPRADLDIVAQGYIFAAGSRTHVIRSVLSQYIEI